MKTSHEVLRDARAILAERGLAKGVLQDDDGSVCIRGAMLCALGYEPGCKTATWDDVRADDVARLAECEAALGWELPIGFGLSWVPPIWNNAPERTLEDALERLDKAIIETHPGATDAAPALV